MINSIQMLNLKDPKLYLAIKVPQTLENEIIPQKKMK